jgi:murein DD-endopeptidase MepM/ murein hydrolase activator NlpD
MSENRLRQAQSPRTLSLPKCPRIPVLLGLFLFFAISTYAQDDVGADVHVRTDTMQILQGRDYKSVPAIPANELYQNTWSEEHIRLRNWQFEHSYGIILALISPETPSFSMPARNFTVISPYGMRGSRMHTGIDLKQTSNDTIFAVFDGMVRMAKPYSSYGNLIVIRHPNGLETIYSHLSEMFVNPFQIVKAGEGIGLAGRTGRATTEHLHFEIRFLYEHFDPEILIDFENECLRMEITTFIGGRLQTDEVIEETSDDQEIEN